MTASLFSKEDLSLWVEDLVNRRSICRNRIIIQSWANNVFNPSFWSYGWKLRVIQRSNRPTSIGDLKLLVYSSLHSTDLLHSPVIFVFHTWNISASSTCLIKNLDMLESFCLILKRLLLLMWSIVFNLDSSIEMKLNCRASSIGRDKDFP